jgi:alkanesulfonate monooxygenase SsuD/methylene tetrahydromethanopterin reductase-like flavin-dependent oxidoreductase (luciferase family)
MKAGVTLFAQNYGDWDRYEAAERGESSGPGPAEADARIYQEELALGRLVEPLGFDSLWTVEHHFTPYTMVSNPFQFLSYFAGCTERIDMGTMVTVLPWHDPLRVAEEIIMLEHMLQGRTLTLGLGRGAGRREFEGLRVPMERSREMFAESVDILRAALADEWFSYEGSEFQIPRTSLRPAPRSKSILDRFYCAWGSPSTIEIAARQALKPLFIPQKPFDVLAAEVAEFSRITLEIGEELSRPKVVCWVYCAETEDLAAEGAHRYLAEYAETAVRHYQLTGEHFASTRGYENYAASSKLIRQSGTDQMVRDYLSNHVWGTPEQCIERVERINDCMGPDEFICVMMYGSMSGEVAEKSMRLFASEVLPAVHEMAPAPMVAPATEPLATLMPSVLGIAAR